MGFPYLPKGRIIRILGYLGLLDNDISFFDQLPKETLGIIASNLDCESLSLFCQISSTFNKFFCITGDLTEILRVKLQEETRLDLSHYDQKELGLLCQMNQKKTIISAGTDHSLIVNSQGQVYSFGNNVQGQLGLGDPVNRDTPSLITTPGLGYIISVSAGGRHSLILNSQGQVFSFGSNINGELGLGEMGGRDIPTLITNPKIGRIIAISAGYNHSLLLNSRGQVFAFGSNEVGKLGRDNMNKSFIPLLVKTSGLGKIVAISAGSDDSFLLNSQGQVFGFGDNDHGQLGLGDIKSRNTPTLIDLPEVVAISAWSSHSLFLDSQGQVFGSGANGFGQLGLGDLNNRNLPTPIDQSEIGQVTSIETGGRHSIILNSQGQIFTFGNNQNGRLGLGYVTDQPFPTLVDNSVIGDIIAISVGRAHSLILNSQGQLFSFGHSGDGQLGLGNVDSQFTPVLIKGISIL
jgi:alpha-tubulin suppressor-like RCC1 family protein